MPQGLANGALPNKMPTCNLPELASVDSFNFAGAMYFMVKLRTLRCRQPEMPRPILYPGLVSIHLWTKDTHHFCSILGSVHSASSIPSVVIKHGGPPGNRRPHVCWCGKFIDLKGGFSRPFFICLAQLSKKFWQLELVSVSASTKFSIKGAMAWSNIYTDENMRVLRRVSQIPERIPNGCACSVCVDIIDHVWCLHVEKFSDQSIAKMMQLKPTVKHRKPARMCFRFVFLCHLKWVAIYVANCLSFCTVFAATKTGAYKKAKDSARDPRSRWRPVAWMTLIKWSKQVTHRLWFLYILIMILLLMRSYAMFESLIYIYIHFSITSKVH